MKRWQAVSIAVLSVTLWSWAISGPALGQGRGQGFRPCPYTPYSCPLNGSCKPFDEKGKVVRVFTETLEDSMHPGMALLLDTKNRGQVHVSLGPVWYLERQEFELKAGDEVQVKGMCVKERDGRLQVVAFQVFHKEYVLNLRDDQGRPNWEAWRKR